MEAAFKKWGNSQGIIIPKPILEIVGIQENEPVDISVEEGAIVIRKFRPVGRRTIEELFAGFEGKHQSEEIDWGTPVGEEVW